MKKLGVQPEGWAPYFPKQAAGIHRKKAWQNTGSAHFALTAEEMKQIGGMDKGKELFFEHDSPEMARMFGNYHIY